MLIAASVNRVTVLIVLAIVALIVWLILTLLGRR
jgi:hypothetical protein